jgi:8-oxo-dGTP diphosphatase
MEENDTPNSVLIVVRKGNKILVVERSKTDTWMPLRWSYPGGHIQKNETPYYAAKRELEEETGIKAKHVVYAGIRNTTNGKMYIYLCDDFDFNSEVKLNFEHSDHKWITYDDISDLNKQTPFMKQIAATALEIPLGY